MNIDAKTKFNLQQNAEPISQNLGIALTVVGQTEKVVQTTEGEKFLKIIFTYDDNAGYASYFSSATSFHNTVNDLASIFDNFKEPVECVVNQVKTRNGNSIYQIELV